MPFDPAQLKTFPTLPGVYLMKAAHGKVLYIGKAKDLRARLQQYFVAGRDGRLMIPYLTTQIEDIEIVIVNSEKEALILENNLIKQHQPKYNALLKDDKTFFSLMINHQHPWPMIRIVRYKGKAPTGNLYFGPYAHGAAARETLDLLRQLFPLRQCSDRELVSRLRPCILHGMKRCIAPCVAACTSEEYATLVEKAIRFLNGHDREIIKELKAEMAHATEQLQFEKAGHLYKKLQAIEKTLEKQKVEQAGLVDLDVLGLYREGDQVMLCQLFFREGKLIHLAEYFFLHNAQSDEALIASFLLQHYLGAEHLPEAILLPLALEGSSIIAGLLEGMNKKIHLFVPKRGRKKELLTLAKDNAQSRFIRRQEKENQKEQILIALEETLQLTNYPEEIECFDNSHIFGDEPVSAMVVFIKAEPKKSFYRKYILRETGPSDDYGALREVLSRRYKKAKEAGHLPDLLVIDGGKGHLNVALKCLSELDISTVDVIAIAKEEGRHDKGMSAEQIFISEGGLPIVLPFDSPLLFFLQRLRDEAHRFALSFQRVRRGKKSLATALQLVPGIGPIKQRRLLRHFGSLKRLLAAEPSRWREVDGITQKDVDALKKLQAEEKEKGA